MVFMFGVCPCGSKRVGVLLIRGRVKGRCFYRPLPVRWAYEDEIEKGPTVPGVRPADEEERQDVLLQCLFDRFGSVFPQCGLMVFPGVVIVSR